MKKMSSKKRKKLEHHVFNVMKRKDKGRSKTPAMTNKWGKVVKLKWKSLKNFLKIFVKAGK